MTTQTTTDADAVGLGRGGRMSRQCKRDAVLRLLRGEDLELVLRSLGVTAARLADWREAFLAAGEASLATRPTNGEALESELLEAKIAALEAGDPRPLARRQGKPNRPTPAVCDHAGPVPQPATASRRERGQAQSICRATWRRSGAARKSPRRSAATSSGASCHEV